MLCVAPTCECAPRNTKKNSSIVVGEIRSKFPVEIEIFSRKPKNLAIINQDNAGLVWVVKDIHGIRAKRKSHVVEM